MASYHMTDDGPKKCDTTPDKCPLQAAAEKRGETVEHFNNLTEANARWGASLAAQHAHDSNDSLRKNNDASTMIQPFYNGENTQDLTIYDVSAEIPEAFKDEDHRLYTETKITGCIDLNKLNEQSYKEFGFAEHDSDELTDRISTDYPKYRKHTLDGKIRYLSTSLSEVELAQLSEKELGVLNYYTSDNYAWMNNALYNPDSFDTLPDTLEQAAELNGSNKWNLIDKEEMFTSFIGSSFRFPSNQQRSKELLGIATKRMDEALEKTKGQQRIVYRGASNDLPEGANMSDWIDQNRQVGTVVNFKGYTSATYSPFVASCFSAQKKSFADALSGKTSGKPQKLLYEILTPEGAAVESITQCNDEEEVVLPRNRNYVVVGVQKNIHVDLISGESDYHVVQMVAVDDEMNVLTGDLK